MSLPNVVKSSIYSDLVLTWSPVLDLTGATLTGTITDRNGDGSRAITGTLAVSSAEAGIFTWSPSSADVATAGAFYVQFTATIGGEAEKSERLPWWVKG